MIRHKKKIYFLGSVFLLLAFLTIVALLLFVQRSTPTIFLSSVRNQSQYQWWIFDALVNYGEILLGCFGSLAGCFYPLAFFCMGYAFFKQRVSWSFIFLLMQNLLLLSLYTAVYRIQCLYDVCPGGIIGYRLSGLCAYFLLTSFYPCAIALVLSLHLALLIIVLRSISRNQLIPSLKVFFKASLYYIYDTIVSINNRFFLFVTQLLLVHKKQDSHVDSKQDVDGISLSNESTLKDQKMPIIKSNKYSINFDIIFEKNKLEYDEAFVKEAEVLAAQLEQKLARCGIKGSVIGMKQGPVVTLFEYKIEGDTKIQKIVSLEDDLVMALEALSIRIRAPIPGTSLIGFEVANKKRLFLKFGSLITSKEYKNLSIVLPVVFGCDTQGNPALFDLLQMPHLLIAGATGSGKSVTVHGILISLLGRCSPQLLRCILIDPKRLELHYYNDIPHLLFPVIYERAQAVAVLQWVIDEMNRRYVLIGQARVRNSVEYNFLGQEQLPFIVVVIDELADLMMSGGKDIEMKIVRIAQMARAAGIHMIVATQRPSVDVVTGLIKVNFPSRIALRVTSRSDSRTILDTIGAHQLLGKGDMLFLDGISGILHRLHAAFIATKEIEKFVGVLKNQGAPNYLSLVDIDVKNEHLIDDIDADLYKKAVEFLGQIDEVSISLLQRKFRIGYNRAARMIDLLQAQGHILPPHNGKVRKIVR